MFATLPLFAQRFQSSTPEGPSIWLIVLGAIAGVLASGALGAAISRWRDLEQQDVVAGALIGALLGPLGWLILVTFADKRPVCPECRSHLRYGVLRCRHCGTSFTSPVGG